MPMARWMLRIFKPPTENAAGFTQPYRCGKHAHGLGIAYMPSYRSVYQTQQGYSLAEFTTDLVKNNSLD